MGILNALGFGLFLVITALLLPSVFLELGKTFVTFLHSLQEALIAAGVIASYAGHIPTGL